MIRVPNSTTPLILAQAIAGLAVARRLLHAAQRRTIPATAATPPRPTSTVSILIPVLNEQARLARCLEGAIQQGPVVTEILVIDGGSTDLTRQLIAAYAARDPRVRLVDAAPLPPAWNGKAWGLEQGWRASTSTNPWLLCLDADVYPAPTLAAALVTFAQAEKLAILSVATQQVLPPDLLAGLLHPAFLTTLIYRLGPPGSVAHHWQDVQANGQCMLIHRHVLDQLGGFAPAAHSRCEDITIARLAARQGFPVGFFEADGLVWVQMHRDGQDVWRSWPRSLVLHDTLAGWRTWRDLLLLTAVQAAPLPITLIQRLRRSPQHDRLALLNTALLAMRLGTLWGTRPAYRWRPWTYWLSPMVDPIVVAKLWRSAFQRRHVWRGRLLEGSV